MAELEHGVRVNQFVTVRSGSYAVNITSCRSGLDDPFGSGPSLFSRQGNLSFWRPKWEKEMKRWDTLRETNSGKRLVIHTNFAVMWNIKRIDIPVFWSELENFAVQFEIYGMPKFPPRTIFVVETPGSAMVYRHYQINHGRANALSEVFKGTLGKHGWLVLDRNSVTKSRVDGAGDDMHYSGPIVNMLAQMLMQLAITN